MSAENTNFISNGLANYTHGSRRENKEKRAGYRERYTCVPNCDQSNGGPPYAQFSKIS